jgi:putative membrane protein
LASVLGMNLPKMFGYAFDMVWRWLITTLAILMVPSLVTSVEVDGFATALAAAAILGVLNVVLRPLLVLLTLPLTLFSFGIFLLFINAFIFEVAGWIVQGMEVKSFGGAFLASLIVTAVSWILSWRWPWDRKPREVLVVRRSWARSAPGARSGGGARGANRSPAGGATVDLEKREDGKWE